MKKEYKLRAECSYDTDLLLSTTPDLEVVEVERFLYGGLELTFKSSMDLEKLRTEISKVEDSHVMYQTVQETANYTGERDYSINF